MHTKTSESGKLVAERRRRSGSAASVAVFAVAALTIAMPSGAWAAALYVSNAGVDSGACGVPTAPCRSISQAIFNAGVGDKIIVGPGRYGDVNGDGDFDDPGDEKGEIGTGCYCTLNVNKQVSLYSRDGAAVTIIDGESLGVAVNLSAPGAVVGKRNKGFTMANSRSGSITYWTVFVGAAGVTVAGNLVLPDGGGLGVYSNGNTIQDNWILGTGQRLLLNGKDNRVTGNVSAGSQGIQVYQTDNNVLESNVVVGSGDSGFDMFSGSGLQFSRNVSIGNRQEGIYVESGGVGGTVIDACSVYGNSIAQNCGVSNDSTQTVTVTKSYWGAPAGPGDDPADDVCGATLLPQLDGIAPKEIRAKRKPMR